MTTIVPPKSLTILLLICFMFLIFIPCRAAPTVSAAVNAASYLNAGLPNGKLAQGGMFILFGAEMGPVSLGIISTFPLPTNLTGTSARVTVGATTVDCIMIYTSASQIAAILASNVPTGNGTLTVTYNGQTSPPLNIEIAQSNFGIFALNEGGSGHGIFLDPVTNEVNTLLNATNPAATLDIWGTGLGPVSGDEVAGPLPGDMSHVDVQVWVGDKQAEVTYRGRSGCCAGIDQIRFIVPSGLGLLCACYGRRE